MKKASEYWTHAQECRALAKRMGQGEHRDQLIAMAETWERLAEQRETTSNCDAVDGTDADSPERSKIGATGGN